MPRKLVVGALTATLLGPLAACGHSSSSSPPPSSRLQAASSAAPSAASAASADPGAAPSAAPTGPGGAVSAAPGAATPAAAQPSDSPPGTRTCTLLGQAVHLATLMEPGVITAIQAASATADAPVGDAAQRLAAAYAKAVASHNTPQEPNAIAAVSAAAADMSAVCNESGLETTG